MKDRKILIAIPMYNCAKQIGRVLSDIQDQVAAFEIYSVELLVLDNCSSDNSYEIAKDSLEKVHLVSHLEKNPSNLGLGGSQKRAFQWAQERGFEILVVLHGDHQASAKDIFPLVQRILSSSDIAVLGSRFTWKSKRIGYSKVRTIGNLSLNLIYSVLSGRKITDLGSGLNAFRISFFSMSLVTSFSNGFTFNMDLLLSLLDQKAAFTFVPITWTEYDQVSNARNLKVGWAALKAVLKWKFS